MAFAQAIYSLLAKSDRQEWFSAQEVAAQAGVGVRGAFVARVLGVSTEQDEDVFNYSSDNGEAYYSLGKEGFLLVEQRAFATNAEKAQAPASDRVVQFDHNAPDAKAIADGIEATLEAVRGSNDPDIDLQERERVSVALKSARDLWQSGQLRVIQIKVGVLLAVQDAVALLTSTAKQVAAALLVDAIKSFAKQHFKIDLDAV